MLACESMSLPTLPALVDKEAKLVCILLLLFEDPVFDTELGLASAPVLPPDMFEFIELPVGPDALVVPLVLEEDPGVDEDPVLVVPVLLPEDPVVDEDPVPVGPLLLPEVPVMDEDPVLVGVPLLLPEVPEVDEDPVLVDVPLLLPEVPVVDDDPVPVLLPVVDALPEVEPDGTLLKLVPGS